jgi:hypothetical protein
MQKYEGRLDMKIKELLCMGITFILFFATEIDSECKCTQPWKPEYGSWNRFCGRELRGDCIPDALYNCTLGKTVEKMLFECKEKVPAPSHFCSPYLVRACTLKSTNTSLGPTCLAKRGCYPNSFMIIGMEERYGKGHHSFS